jgi:hypothetical protein
LSNTYNVDTIAKLNAVIEAIDALSQAATGVGDHYVINLKANATFYVTAELEAINLRGADTLDIEGDGATLDGAGPSGDSYNQRGLFVYAGHVSIENLTIENMKAIGGAGGPGSGPGFGGGGGGAGLGGGLFLGANVAGAPANVTLSNVNFLKDSATGGNGGGRGGGGGGGGFFPYTGGGAGGGGGEGAGAVNGAFGGQGGFGGGGGGGGSSGFGGGGPGGFGGGGGGGLFYSGGHGGFGGGGGGSYYAWSGGSPGFGGGHGFQQGGGGLGAGGDIFVQSGATLTIESGSLSGGGVTGGAGAASGGNGKAFGSGIFLQGDENIRFDPAAGVVETISDVIADQTGSGGTGANAGAGGLILDGPGKLVLDAKNSFTGGVTLDQGILEIGPNGKPGQGAIAFAGDAALLVDGSNIPSNLLRGFTTGDDIDLANVAYDLNGVATLNPMTHVLTITEHGNSIDLNFDSSVRGTTFQLSSFDSGQGTEITNCFMAGTLVRTPEGEVAVETLRRGDLVMTAEGGVQPVAWLGRQTVSTRFADPLRSWPIRVKAGALGENVPARDLLLSPDHALLIEDVLIHAGALVNGTSIVREKAVPEVFVYYHVELDDHALILAENTPAETFVDNVDRLAFDNWAEHEALYPEGKPIEELPHPRAKGRRQVPTRIRARLDERAKVIGGETISAVA